MTIRTYNFFVFRMGLPNNLTDPMLSIFKQIMSLANSKTAWIQVVCTYWAMGFLPFLER